MKIIPLVLMMVMMMLTKKQNLSQLKEANGKTFGDDVDPSAATPSKLLPKKISADSDTESTHSRSMNVTVATGDYNIPYLVESSDSDSESGMLDEDSPSKTS